MTTPGPAPSRPSLSLSPSLSPSLSLPPRRPRAQNPTLPGPIRCRLRSPSSLYPLRPNRQQRRAQPLWPVTRHPARSNPPGGRPRQFLASVHLACPMVPAEGPGPCSPPVLSRPSLPNLKPTCPTSTHPAKPGRRRPRLQRVLLSPPQLRCPPPGNPQLRYPQPHHPHRRCPHRRCPQPRYPQPQPPRQLHRRPARSMAVARGVPLRQRGQHPRPRRTAPRPPRSILRQTLSLPPMPRAKAQRPTRRPSRPRRKTRQFPALQPARLTTPSQFTSQSEQFWTP